MNDVNRQPRGTRLDYVSDHVATVVNLGNEPVPVELVVGTDRKLRPNVRQDALNRPVGEHITPIIHAASADHDPDLIRPRPSTGPRPVHWPDADTSGGRHSRA